MHTKANIITGQLLLRPSSKEIHDGSDREIFIVAGVVAVPKGTKWKGEHFVPVVSVDYGETLQLMLEDQFPIPDESRGLRLDQIITSPYWRC